MIVRVPLTKITAIHRAVKGQELNQIKTSRNTILDITATVIKLGLDPQADIIFNGSDEVAVERWGPNTPPYNETGSPIIVLKVTDKADLGQHDLIVTGASNKKQTIGKQVTIDLKVTI